MDLFTIFRILARRWYVGLPLVAITAVSMFGFWRQADPSYQSQASILLVAEQRPGAAQEDVKNPLLSVGNPALAVMASTVQTLMTNPAVKKAIHLEVPAGTYSVDIESEKTPVLTITASGPTASTASHTMDSVLETLDGQLTALQRDFVANSQEVLQARTLVAPDKPSVQYTRIIRTLVVLGVLGLMAAMSLAILVDGTVASRRDGRRTAGVTRDAKHEEARSVSEDRGHGDEAVASNLIHPEGRRRPPSEKAQFVATTIEDQRSWSPARRGR